LYFQELRKFIWAYGPSNTTLTNASNLSWIWAQKFQNIDSAATILQNYVDAPYLNKKIIAEAKITLGDIYAESSQTYKSELLYAQVEKAFTEDEMGQLAKFKRAELSFYRGDFDWANMQLDVLKGATTRLISNNAMELSLCITDNLGVDSNFTALEYYGKALLFQRQKLNDSALNYLNKITIEFPGHSLGDEVLMRKAQIEKSRKNYDRASQIFDVLIAAYPDDILHDNALFEAAQLNQYQLKNTPKALELYQALIDKHTDSIFIVDARKEYRKLRGF
jgi:tetratricopeptide (TPR) repeat protein